jgi:hypothetical protein
VQDEAETALRPLSKDKLPDHKPGGESRGFKVPTFLRHTLLVESEPTSEALLGEQMGNRFLREKGKTQRLVVAAIEQGKLRHKVKEMARKISTLAISYWHFPK